MPDTPDGATGRLARREGQPSAERAAPPAYLTADA